MPETVLEIIRKASHKIQAFLVLAGNKSSGPLLGPVEIQNLASRLQQVGQILEGNLLPERHDPEVRAELMEYQRNLEQLQPVLKGVREGLLKRRARIEAEKAQLDAAGKWATVYKETV